jgi:hypothetical protein
MLWSRRTRARAGNESYFFGGYKMKTEDLIVVMDKETCRVRELKGRLFSGDAARGLDAALAYASDEGYVASLPQIVRARIMLMDDVFPESPLISEYLRTSSEIAVGKDGKGDDVVVVSHGCGILSSPDRIRRAYDEGLTRFGGAKTNEQETHDLLSGKHKGKTVPVMSVEKLLDYESKIVPPCRVYMPLAQAKEAKMDVSIDQILSCPFDYPLLVASLGGVEQTGDYLMRLKKHYDSHYAVRGGPMFEFTHVLDAIDLLRPGDSQANLIGIGAEYRGIFADEALNVDNGLFVAVSGKDIAAFERRSWENQKKMYWRKFVGAVTVAGLAGVGTFVGITNSVVDENRSHVRRQVFEYIAPMVSAGELDADDANLIIKDARLGYLESLHAKRAQDVIDAAKAKAGSRRKRK